MRTAPRTSPSRGPGSVGPAVATRAADTTRSLAATVPGRSRRRPGRRHPGASRLGDRRSRPRRPGRDRDPRHRRPERTNAHRRPPTRPATATFTYTGTAAGTDTITATATVAGVISISNAAASHLDHPRRQPARPRRHRPRRAVHHHHRPVQLRRGDLGRRGGSTHQPAILQPDRHLASDRRARRGRHSDHPRQRGRATRETLATFDPAAVTSGTYAITVTATTAAGSSASASVDVIVPPPGGGGGGGGGGTPGGGTAAQAPPTITNVTPADGSSISHLDAGQRHHHAAHRRDHQHLERRSIGPVPTPPSCTRLRDRRAAGDARHPGPVAASRRHLPARHHRLRQRRRVRHRGRLGRRGRCPQTRPVRDDVQRPLHSRRRIHRRRVTAVRQLRQDGRRLRRRLAARCVRLPGQHQRPARTRTDGAQFPAPARCSGAATASKPPCRTTRPSRSPTGTRRSSTTHPAGGFGPLYFFGTSSFTTRHGADTLAVDPATDPGPEVRIRRQHVLRIIPNRHLRAHPVRTDARQRRQAPPRHLQPAS